jgi:preprotein translocase subunit SecE
MADEIKKTAAEASEKKNDKSKKDSASKPKKEGNVFSRAWKAIKKFFKDVRGECKKVVWPDAKTVFKSTGIVLLCVAVLGLIIWLIDTGLSAGIQGIVTLANNHAAGDAETTTQAAAEAVTEVAGVITGFLGR